MRYFLLLTALTICVGTYAQGFAGSIEFKQISSKDTANNIYLVKGNLVKLNRFEKRVNALEGSYIFDLNENKIKYVNPKRKIWGEHKSETPPVIRGTCTVTKGGTKKIAGYKCTEYTVKNTEENTVITYWITDGKFIFFKPMMTLWNRKDKLATYYLQITGLPQGAMPFFSEERQISDNKLLNRLEVDKVITKAPDDASLEVPPGYTKFE